jgi:hypothetical protein
VVAREAVIDLPKERELIPRETGQGALKGPSHGGYTYLQQCKAGGIRKDTVVGKAHHAIVFTLSAVVKAHTGEDPTPLEMMMIEQCTQAYLLQRLVYSHTINTAATGKDAEPPAPPKHYGTWVNQLGKALDRLAQHLETSRAKVEKALADADFIEVAVEGEGE